MMKNKSYTDLPIWLYIIGFIVAVLFAVWITCSFVKPQDDAPFKKNIHAKGRIIHTDNGKP